MTVPVKTSKLIKGTTGDWEVVIGLEVHAQVTSNSKLFSGASTAFGGEPNSHVSLVDAAMPGMLPVMRPDVSFVDLTRSGVALMEIVSKPDIRDADQAKAYVTKLRSILRYLGTCDGDMEKGNLRADVNVSVRKPGGPLGTRCEIKNMNSINFIGQAIEYEARRQVGILEDGGAIDQETRLFDA